jgi:hypothetical protein
MELSHERGARWILVTSAPYRVSSLLQTSERTPTRRSGLLSNDRCAVHYEVPSTSDGLVPRMRPKNEESPLN